LNAVPTLKRIEMERTENISPLFPLGNLLITPTARDLLTPEIIANLLQRHQCGDWGDMTAEDKQENDYSVPRALRIFSAYNVGEGERVWLITEADRSATTILTPEDY
jgi:hypothetical protein